MTSRFATIDKERPMAAVLKVVGIGGGGCNAIESMIKRGLIGVEYVAINTDAQVLNSSSATYKIQVGTSITRGLGAGADPNVGKKSLEEDREKIAEVLSGSDMVFVTAGMGGGTGTGGAPVIASIAKSIGSLVVGIVTKPFRWEGKKRMLNAEQGIQELKQHVDSLIVIPNERLLSILDKSINAFAAFDKPNEVLYEATRGIADIITIEGLINVDFADVRAVMNQSGEALMGCGIASGENRAIEAAQKAISSPLLEGINIKGAKSVLLNVTGSSNLTMQEINEGNNVIFEAAGEEANVIFGVVNKESMTEYISYTVIATGFETKASSKPISSLKSEKAERKQDLPDRQAGKKVGSIGAAFSTKKGADLENSEDLSIPTILRYNKGDLDLFARNTNIESGFRAEHADYSEDDFSQSKKNSDEEDSSSFLRKIMD